jgi:hypothetical protein
MSEPRATSGPDFNTRLDRIERDLVDRREAGHTQNTKWIEMVAEMQQLINDHDKVIKSIPQAFAANTAAFSANTAVLVKLETAIAGDDLGNKGLLGRITANEQGIAVLKTIVDGHDRKLWAAGIGFGAAWALLLALKDKLLH